MSTNTRVGDCSIFSSGAVRQDKLQITQFFEWSYFRRQKELEARMKTGSSPTNVFRDLMSISIFTPSSIQLFRVFIFQIITQYRISVFRFEEFGTALGSRASYELSWELTRLVTRLSSPKRHTTSCRFFQFFVKRVLVSRVEESRTAVFSHSGWTGLQDSTGSFTVDENLSCSRLLFSFHSVPGRIFSLCLSFLISVQS